MRVRFKPTNQTGTIPDNMFDPTQFDSLDQPTTPTGVDNTMPTAARTPTPSLLGNVASLPGKAFNFLMPSTSQAIRQLPQNTKTALDMGMWDFQNPAQDIPEWLGRQRARVSMQAGQSLPIAGEIAPWLMGGLGGAAKGATALQRIGSAGLAGAKRGLAVGTIAGGSKAPATAEMFKDVLIRGKLPNVGAAISQTLPSTVFGGILGGGLSAGTQGLAEGARAVADKFKSFGVESMAGKVQPPTGEKIGFATREEKVAEEAILKKTSAITPRGIDKQMEVVKENLSNEVQTKLAEQDKPLLFSLGGNAEHKLRTAQSMGTQFAPGQESPVDIESKILSDVEKNVSGFDLKSPKWAKPFEQVLYWMRQKTTQAPLNNAAPMVNAENLPVDELGRPIGATVGQMNQNAELQIKLTDLFKSKQDIGIYLDKNKVWAKLASNQPLTEGDRVGLAVYNSTKEIIDEATGNAISDLTNAQHMVYQAGAGIYELAHRGASQNPSVFALYRFPLLSVIPQALDVITLAFSRGIYNVGDALKSGDPKIMKAVVPVLNVLINQFANTESKKQNTPQTTVPETQETPKVYTNMADRAKDAQTAIDTAQDAAGTYNRIVSAEPDLVPYLSPR